MDLYRSNLCCPRVNCTRCFVPGNYQLFIIELSISDYIPVINFLTQVFRAGVHRPLNFRQNCLCAGLKGCTQRLEESPQLLFNSPKCPWLQETLKTAVLSCSKFSDLSLLNLGIKNLSKHSYFFSTVLSWIPGNGDPSGTSKDVWKDSNVHTGHLKFKCLQCEHL